MKLKPLFFLLPVLCLVACNGQEDEAVNYNYGDDSLSTAVSLVNDHRLKARWPESFEIGRRATRTEIKRWDIDISPDGTGLPPGNGNVMTGRAIYEIKCLACHGRNGMGGSQSRLLGIMGDTAKVKAIGNYWPYSSTLFDYIRRAMPYNAPGSLTNDEVYSLSAYLLYINKIIDSTGEMNRRTLPKVKMPAKDLFISDDRRGGPEVR